MIYPEDRFDEIGRQIALWEAEEVKGSPEDAAAEASEVTLEQRLGGRLEQTIGGMMLRMNPLMDPDLVGEEFPEEILNIPNLVYLDISGMKFGALPENIDRLVTLQTLVASRNDLTALPEQLGNITGLKKLFVNKNDLKGVPTSLTQCTELKTLDLKDNPMTAETLDQIEQMLGEDVKVNRD
ncbi:MAG: leucine-rich repeat domain-containing protein [Flavobacteriales bacterium]|nr:leucine-rich repeat domain-containing protein [Flavobacteriales bacterium]